MNAGFWLSRPLMAFHRLRYWCWEKLNPSMPWLCPGTIRFCERHLSREARVLEWGSGRSTVWLAGLTAHVTSVEHDPRWFRTVERTLDEKSIVNVDYRLVPLDHPEPEGERETYDPLPAYVRVAESLPDRSLGLVVVDGHYRTHCVRAALPKLAPGGLLLVDDVNFWPSVAAIGVPAGWELVDDSGNGLKRCLIWKAARG